VNAISRRAFDVEAVVAAGVTFGHSTRVGTTRDVTAPSTSFTFTDEASTRRPVATLELTRA